MYVLDTDTLIYFFKQMGNVPTRFLQIPPQEIGIPSIVLFELEVGIGKLSAPQKRIEQLTAVLSNVKVLPFGEREAKIAAQIRVTLESQGQPIGPYDTLIAATALAENAILVTRNTREFGRVPQLKVENWF